MEIGKKQNKEAIIDISKVVFLHIQSNLHKRATFWKYKTVYYTKVAVLSRFSQNICHVESRLSVRFIRKISKEDLAVCMT